MAAPETCNLMPQREKSHMDTMEGSAQMAVAEASNCPNGLLLWVNFVADAGLFR